jgi:hypothetical protein
MRVLLVSGYFPPFAPMSGVRANKLAKYLLERGYDIRVLAASDLPYPPVIPLEIPPDRVLYSRFSDVNYFPKRVAELRGRLRSRKPLRGGTDLASVDVAAQVRPSSGGVLRRASELYVQLTNWPDSMIGWRNHAIRDGRRLLEKWRADLVYATAPPHTGLLVARHLADTTGIPWVAEFRDLWVDHPYYDEPVWRRRLERLHERKVLASAAALVTVSDVWGEQLQERFGKPTAVILNGFDPADHPEDAPSGRNGEEGLRIVYAGGIYPGRRDPKPLFQAIATLGELGRKIRVDFYGTQPIEVQSIAADAGLSGQIGIYPSVPFATAVARQREADILLLLRWNNESERGVVPGKLFEYIGARRPILALGWPKGAVPDIINTRRLGMISNDPIAIARQLAIWIEEKERNGFIAPLPLDTRAALSRDEQFAQLENFLHDVVKRRSSTGG